MLIGQVVFNSFALDVFQVCQFYPLKVGAQTETELKEKKLRVEDALNATKVIFLAIKMLKDSLSKIFS